MIKRPNYGIFNILWVENAGKLVEVSPLASVSSVECEPQYTAKPRYIGIERRLHGILGFACLPCAVHVTDQGVKVLEGPWKQAYLRVAIEHYLGNSVIRRTRNPWGHRQALQSEVQ